MYRSWWPAAASRAMLAAVAALLLGCAAPRSVYVGASDKFLYALLGTDGSLRWKQPLGGAVHSTPVRWAGNVIVAAADGTVYAFDADSAKPLWQAQLMSPQQAGTLPPQNVLSTPTMPINGRLFIGTGLGDVFEVGAAGGAVTLRAQLGVPGRQWLASSADGKLVFVASSAGRAYAVDARAGGIVWQQTVAPVGAPAQAPNGGVVVPVQSGLTLLDAAHGGAFVTSYTAAGLVEGAAVDMNSGLTFIVDSTGRVQQLALQAGSPPAYSFIWTAAVTNAAGYPPYYGGAAAINVALFVSFVNGTAASVTPNSGGVNWNQRIDTDLAAAPAYGTITAQDKMAVLVVSTAGHVYALDPATGATLWKQASVIAGSVDASVALP